MNSKSVVEHKDHVHKILANMQDFGFKIKVTKCDFFMEKIKYLGHIIDMDDRRSDPKQSEELVDLANYYLVFMQNMHDLHAPVN